MIWHTIQGADNALQLGAKYKCHFPRKDNHKYKSFSLITNRQAEQTDFTRTSWLARGRIRDEKLQNWTRVWRLTLNVKARWPKEDRKPRWPKYLHLPLLNNEMNVVCWTLKLFQIQISVDDTFWAEGGFARWSSILSKSQTRLCNCAGNTCTPHCWAMRRVWFIEPWNFRNSNLIKYNEFCTPSSSGLLVLYSQQLRATNSVLGAAPGY